MSDRLPPLTALRAFDAAARHMSFSKAAAELFVTPAALSYQIKQLEQHLGTPVFRRLNRAVELTAAGKALQPRVAEGFASFRRAVRAVERLSESTDLTITAGPAFTAKWLAPRFFRFATDHPELELRFVASLKMLDFETDGVDAAIRFGTGMDEGLYSEVLADDWATPVCVPSMAGEIRERGDLVGAHLLHDESSEFLNIPVDWPRWMARTGIAGDPSHGAHFTNTEHAIDVALEGVGVALGRIVLVERYLESGQLVAPFPIGLRLGAQYRFVCPMGAETTPEIATFLDWIREEFQSLKKHAACMTLLDPEEEDQQ